MAAKESLRSTVLAGANELEVVCLQRIRSKLDNFDCKYTSSEF